MKSYFRLLLVSAVLAPAALMAASFEGKVTMKMTSGKNQTQDITYSVKGDKIRMEMPAQKGAAGSMIMDTTKKEMIMMMDEQKMYMVMSMAGALEAAEKKSDDVKLEKTDETEKILGYTATKYILTEKNTETEMWLAEGLGTFMGFSNRNPMGGRGRGQSAPAGWERALEGKDLFPLRVVGREGGGSSKGKGAEKSKDGKGGGKERAGNESFRMEVTAIDKASLPDSLFSPPAGYQKFDMGGMGGLMKGLIPGAR